MINVVNLVGRVGGDPEVKYFESGTVKATFSLAVNRRQKNQEQPDWFPVELWGKTAEIAGTYVKKGSLIGVRGYLKIESWEDRDRGVHRSRPVIKGNDLHLLGGRREEVAAAEEEA